MLNNKARTVLLEIITDDKYGRAVIDEPQRLKSLLMDLCRDSRTEISVIIAAVNSGVVDELLLPSNATLPIKILIAKQSKQLAVNNGIEKSIATWAVETWALALGIIDDSESTTSALLQRDTTQELLFSEPQVEWWVIVEGEERGPLDKNEIRDLIKQRKITRKTECWCDGMDGWGQISKVKQWAKSFPPERKKPLIKTLKQPPKRTTPTIVLPNYLEPVEGARYASLTGLNSGSREAQALQREWVEKGYPLEVKMKNSGILLLMVPPGEFLMGSKNDPEAYKDEKPQHKVKLSELMYVGKFPVTQGQWQKVMGNNPSSFKKVGSDAPVEQVSWNDVQDFILRIEDSIDLGVDFEIRLLTEAQWEYACRAGTTDSRYGELSTIGWHGGNSGGNTHPVGKKRPNAWGLYDMIGNVWEWCSDWYGGYPINGQSDPKGAKTGSYRVRRGGSWCSIAQICRSANRNSITPGNSYYYLGFRVVAVRKGQADADSRTR